MKTNLSPRLSYSRYSKLLAILLMLSAFCWSTWMVISYIAPFQMDLRNRVVGARMMEDGKSPYYYLWKPGDTERYYDRKINPKSVVSRSTSTPFFHWMMIPVAGLPQFQVNVLWMLIEFGAIVMIYALFMAFAAPDRKTRWLLSISATLFTLTAGWHHHLIYGQNYFVPALLATGLLLCLRYTRGWPESMLFGVFGVALLLMRPITLLMLAPLAVFTLRKYLRNWLALGVVLGAYLLFVFSHPVQRNNWAEYFSSVKVHSMKHLATENAAGAHVADTSRVFEGVSLTYSGEKRTMQYLAEIRANGNFSNIFYALTKRQLSANQVLLAGILAALLLCLPLLFYLRAGIRPDDAQLLLLGFAAYAAFEYCTPVTREIYTFVQWLFPLLLFWLVPMRRWSVPAPLAYFTGLLLQVVPVWLYGQSHLLGQVLLVLAFLMAAYQDIPELRKRLRQ